MRFLRRNLTLPFIRRAVLNSLLNFPLATLVLWTSCTVDCGVCLEGGWGMGVANGSLAAHEDRLGWSRGRRVRGIFSLLIRHGLSPSLSPIRQNNTHPQCMSAQCICTEMCIFMGMELRENAPAARWREESGLAHSLPINLHPSVCSASLPSLLPAFSRGGCLMGTVSGYFR